MSLGRYRTAHHGGSAPATLGFSAVAPEWLPGCGAAKSAAPTIPAAESTLGSHPCVALSSAQVLPEWITITSSRNAFAANGDYPLNFVSHSRGSLHSVSSLPASRASPVGSEEKSSSIWIFCCLSSLRLMAYWPLLLVRAFGPRSRLGLSIAPPFGIRSASLALPTVMTYYALC